MGSYLNLLVSLSLADGLEIKDPLLIEAHLLYVITTFETNVPAPFGVQDG